MIKRALWIALGSAGLLVLGGCTAGKKGSFTVTGTFENADKLAAVAGPISKVYLVEVAFPKQQSPVAVDSAKIPVGKGTFTLSCSARSEKIYELVFGNDVIEVPLINDAPDIRVKVDLGKRDDFYEVRGSDASNQLKDLVFLFGKKKYEVEKSMAEADSLRQANAPDSLQKFAAMQKEAAVQDLSTALKQAINTTADPTVASLALSWAYSVVTQEEFESSLADLLKRYPGNEIIQSMKQGYDTQKAQTAQQDQNPGSQWVGKQVPDFELPDINGHAVSLTSFRGKYLLVDFWASWCGPCRMENPNVVKVHNEFKGKNFAILGVSLDQQKDAWQEAVQSDGLDWTQVSDLKQWDSKAVATFQFNAIPFNLLIDPGGKVIATGLRGEDLENKLKQVLN